MAKVKFDVSGEDAEKNSTVRVFETPPVGVYPARIAACNAEEPGGDKQPRLHVVFEITKPTKNNYPQLHEYINYTEASAWKMDQFLQAIGLATKGKRTGEFEDTKQKGKTLLLYITHRTEEWNGATQTRARISNMLNKNAVVPPELKGKGPSTATAAAEEEPDDNEEIDLVMHGAAADEGDEESIDFLTGKAGEVELDPDAFDTWAELVTAIEAASEEEQDEEEAEDETNLGELVEAADGGDEDAVAELYVYYEANEGTPDPDDYETWAGWLEAAQAAVDGEDTEDEEEEEPDYEAMSTIALKKIARERELPTSGTKEELIERLQEFDASDPFEE